MLKCLSMLMLLVALLLPLPGDARAATSGWGAAVPQDAVAQVKKKEKKKTKKEKKDKKAPAKKDRKAKPAKAPEKPKEPWESPMTATVVRSADPGCEPTCPEWIALEGEITANSPAALRKALKLAGKKKLPVLVNSPGGHLTAAVEIGRMIRKAGLDVAVGWTSYQGCKPSDKSCKLPAEQKGVYAGEAFGIKAFCNSACPLILAAGTRRVSGVWTYVGVHQVRTTWVREKVTYREKYRLVNGKKKVIDRKVVGRKTIKSYEKHGLDKSQRKMLSAYLKEMGVGLGMLDDMEKAPPTSIYQLSLQRQEELKLVTSRGTAVLFTSNSICRTGSAAANCIAGKVPPKPETPAAQAATPTVPAMAPMKVVVVRSSAPGCEPRCAMWISADGAITPETPEQFRTVLAATSGAALPVVVNSTGGDFDAAIATGKLIRSHGRDVLVADTDYSDCDAAAGCTDKPLAGRVVNPGACSGSCVLVLAAGNQRLASEGAAVSVIHPSGFALRSTGQPVETQLYVYLGSMGVANQLLTRMTGLAKDRTDRLIEADLLATRLVTRQVKISDIDAGSVCGETGAALPCPAP